MIDSIQNTGKQLFLTKFDSYIDYLADKRFTQTNPVHEHAMLYAVSATDFGTGLKDLALNQSVTMLSPWVLLRSMIESVFSLVYLSQEPNPSEPVRLFELKLKDLLESKKHITLLDRVISSAKGAESSLKSIEEQILSIPERAKTRKNSKNELKAISIYEILAASLSTEKKMIDGWYGIYSLCCGVSHAQISYLRTHLIDINSKKIVPFQKMEDVDSMVFGNATHLLEQSEYSLNKLLSHRY